MRWVTKPLHLCETSELIISPVKVCRCSVRQRGSWQRQVTEGIITNTCICMQTILPQTPVFTDCSDNAVGRKSSFFFYAQPLKPHWRSEPTHDSCICARVFWRTHVIIPLISNLRSSFTWLIIINLNKSPQTCKKRLRRSVNLNHLENLCKCSSLCEYPAHVWI